MTLNSYSFHFFGTTMIVSRSKVCLLTLTLLVFLSTQAGAQRNEKLVGTYKIVVKAGMKPPAGPPMFVILKKNGEYQWGVDTQGKDTYRVNVSGVWNYTSDRELKLIPAITSPMKEIRYFSDNGSGTLTLRAVERDGHKEPFRDTDMSIQLVKQ